MIFGSIPFLLYFLPAFFILYGIAPEKYRNVVLLIGSFVFYACGELQYFPILGCAIATNYAVGLHLEPPEEGDGKEAWGGRKKDVREKENSDLRRKTLLVAAVVGNIGVLTICKIFLGADGLPLGISFYTFQGLSYLIGVYRGEFPKEQSLLRYAAYIAMFPQIVSGPIVNYGEVRENLRERKFAAAGIQEGLKLFTMGLAAKVLLADRIGLLWRQVQTVGVESISCAYAWMGAIAFSMKLYFDFYGYSLMARGLGQMLGFALPANFKHPYMAHSVRDFYRRWHMTLGRWFFRYVYIPLGGSRAGEWRTICNLFLVWLLTSLWHGFSLNFFLWGGLLWLCIVLERQFVRAGIGRKWRALSRLWVWFWILVTWMCFAITDTGRLGIYLGRMFGLRAGINVQESDWVWALRDFWHLFATAFLACTPAVEKLYRRGKDTFLGILLLASLFWVCVWRITLEGDNPFMYAGF